VVAELVWAVVAAAAVALELEVAANTVERDDALLVWEALLLVPEKPVAEPVATAEAFPPVVVVLREQLVSISSEDRIAVAAWRGGSIASLLGDRADARAPPSA
jgi:hypothetical protein